MRKLSIILIAALLIILAIHSTKTAKADVSVTINGNCGCHTPTPTPVPTPVSTPIPTSTPTAITQPTETPGNNPSSPNGQVGAPICTATKPADPVVTSMIRTLTSETLSWIAVPNADHYLIFYGTTPGSQQFGVPDTGNVTTYTINALNPKLKYYFDVRAVNGCMPSSDGEVLGAATTILGATDSDMALPRLIIAIIATGAAFGVLKKHSI